MMKAIGVGLPGGPEVLIILFVILLLFGAKKLPELSRALGKSLGEFKKGKDDLEKEIREVQQDFHKKATEPEIVEGVADGDEPESGAANDIETAEKN